MSEKMSVIMAMCSTGSVEVVMSRGLIVNWSFPGEKTWPPIDLIRSECSLCQSSTISGSPIPATCLTITDALVDLPAPVIPRIATCLLRSSSCSLNSWDVPERVLTLPSRIPLCPGLRGVGDVELRRSLARLHCGAPPLERLQPADRRGVRHLCQLRLARLEQVPAQSPSARSW